MTAWSSRDTRTSDVHATALGYHNSEGGYDFGEAEARCLVNHRREGGSTQVPPAAHRQLTPSLKHETVGVDRSQLGKICAFVIVFSLVLHANTLSGDFVYDDERGVVKNPDVTGTNAVLEVFRNDFWG